MTRNTVVYHIPVCPFSQRLEILLKLKGQSDAVSFQVVDITKPRDPELLAKTGGSTSLPVLELPDGRILKESLVILDYLDAVCGEGMVARSDPYDYAVERMLIAREGSFTLQGYLFVMNQDHSVRDAHNQKVLNNYKILNDFLNEYNPKGVFLFDDFGLAEAVFAPMFMRFWFLEYFEDFSLPDTPDFDRVRVWQDACRDHPVTQQVTREQIVKLYYDYAMGSGNGALPDGRSVSSFVFSPDWPERPMPPATKYKASATDEDLGLIAHARDGLG